MIETRGIRNNNPFNVRKSGYKWLGKIYPSEDKDFEQFCHMEYGVRCGIKLLKRYVFTYGLHSLDQIINRYAPSSENDVNAYIKYIKNHLKTLGVASDPSAICAPFPSFSFLGMIQAIMLFESKYFLPIADIKSLIDKYHI